MGIEIPVWLFYLLLGALVTPFVVAGSALMIIGGVVVAMLWPKKQEKGGRYGNK